MANSAVDLKQLDSVVGAIENELEHETPTNVVAAQREFLTLLSERALEERPSTISDGILQFARVANPQHNLEAVYLLRLLGAGGPIVEEGLSGELSRAIISIVDRAVPNLSTLLRLNEKRQSFEKYESIPYILLQW